MIAYSKLPVEEWVEWGKEQYGPGDPPWTEERWLEWATKARAKAAATVEAAHSEDTSFASPDKYHSAKTSAEPASPPTAAAHTPDYDSEKELLEATVSMENELTSVRIGYGKFADQTLDYMHKHNAWYLKWAVKEGIIDKPHAQHLAAGLRVRAPVARTAHDPITR